MNLLHTVEPHALDGAGAVAEQRIYASLGTLPLRREHHKPATQLNVGQLAIEVANAMNGAAVDISKWKIIQQIVVSANVKLLGKQLGAFRTHSVQVFYVHILQFVHLFISISAMVKSLG